MDVDEARHRFASSRLAHLATVGEDGAPHLVPIVFVVVADTIYSAVDAKPKRSNRLRRMENVRGHPAVSVLADHYDDADWSLLWWVRADGTGRVLAADDPEAIRAVEALVGRYTQYLDQRPDGPVLAIDVTRWSGWSPLQARES